jgi:hypothetical protein
LTFLEKSIYSCCPHKFTQQHGHKGNEFPLFLLFLRKKLHFIEFVISCAKQREARKVLFYKLHQVNLLRLKELFPAQTFWVKPTTILLLLPDTYHDRRYSRAKKKFCNLLATRLDDDPNTSICLANDRFASTEKVP